MSTATEVREPQVEERVRVRESARAPRRHEVLQTSQQRPLFADSLLDSGKKERTRRRYAAVLSFTFECLLIGALLVVPLMFTEELPRQQLLAFLVAPSPPPPPAAIAKVVRQIQSDLMNTGQLRTLGRIPEKVQMILEEEAPPPLAAIGGVVGGVPGGIPGGQLGGVIGGIVSQTSSLAVIPKLALAQPKRLRVSQGVTKGLLIQKIEPKYPPLALAARISGDVILKAIISKDGNIKELELVSGHPMLTAAAIAAVRQWRFRPFLLSGEAIEVETTVTVTFKIS